ANAGAHLLPEAGATQERTLEAVGWTLWFGFYATAPLSNGKALLSAATAVVSGCGTRMPPLWSAIPHPPRWARVSAPREPRQLAEDPGGTGSLPGNTRQPLDRPVHLEFLPHGERLPTGVHGLQGGTR